MTLAKHNVKEEVGKKLGEYRPLQLMAEGPFGAVWSGENDAGEPRALKILPAADDPSTRLEIRAIQLIAKLDHHNLLLPEKVFSVDKFFVVAMPMADGSLQDYFEAYLSERGTGIDPVELCQLLTQAALGLDFLNVQKHHLGSWPSGIQHCNVKPTNLLLFGDKIKVTDFNIASPTARAVQFGQRINVPAYTAPEVFHGRLSNQTDQYSLAATYVYLRGGRPPFSTVPEPGQLPYLRPAPDLSMLTAKERPIIAKALASAPPERWKTCGELLAKLSEAVRG